MSEAVSPARSECDGGEDRADTSAEGGTGASAATASNADGEFALKVGNGHDEAGGDDQQSGASSPAAVLKGARLECA